MKKLILLIALMMAAASAPAKTLIVYYSFTNNITHIVDELCNQIDADAVEIRPAEKGLDYAADDYAIGSAQIAAIRNAPDNAASYPAIDPVIIDIASYDCIIIGTPLWWSQMAAPMQSFLFGSGKDMAGKNICLIVSSAGSGISGVESDARRLIPDGKFISPALWIRSSQTSGSKPMLESWLRTIGYDSLSDGIAEIRPDNTAPFVAYTISGVRVHTDAGSADNLSAGLYIINGRKTLITE